MFCLPQGKSIRRTTPRAYLVKGFSAIDSLQLIADACGVGTPVAQPVHACRNEETDERLLRVSIDHRELADSDHAR